MIKKILFSTLLLQSLAYGNLLPIIKRSTVIAQHCIDKNSQFFDVNDKAQLHDYYIDAMKTHDKLKELFIQILNSYDENADNASAQIALGCMLLMAIQMIKEFVKVVELHYTTAFSLGFEFRRMINEIKSKEYIDKLYSAMVDLEVALSGEELDNFYVLKDIINSLEVPGITKSLKALKKYV